MGKQEKGYVCVSIRKRPFLSSISRVRKDAKAKRAKREKIVTNHSRLSPKWRAHLFVA